MPHQHLNGGNRYELYTRPTINERAKIEMLREEGASIRAIARKLKRQPSTISCEPARHAGYTADQVQGRQPDNKRNCGVKLKLTPEVKEAVQEKLPHLLPQIITEKRGFLPISASIFRLFQPPP